MRVLFCHDHVFVEGRDEVVYSEGYFDETIWQRYLVVFDELAVVGRSRPLADGEIVGDLNVVSSDRVSFNFVPNFKSARGRLLRRRARAIIAEAVGRADVVIARLPSGVGGMAAREARRTGKPYAAELVGCPWDALWNHGRVAGKLLAPLAFLQVRRLVRDIPDVLYVTREFLQRRYPTSGRAVAISNVDIAVPAVSVLERRLARIREPRTPLVLGLVGAVGHELKGIRTALHALAKARDRLPEFEFRILGPGDPERWQSLVRKLGLQDEVRFCGLLPAGEAVLRWLADIDLYLQPSLQEGLPRATIEAMSRACPALASTAGGLPELLPRECLHRPGDVDGLATLIWRAAADPIWQAAQAAQNFEAARKYTKDVLDERRQAFWRSVAATAERSGAR